MEPVEVDSPALLRALDLNLHLFWMDLRRSSNVDVREDATRKAYITGFPTAIMNGILGARLPADDDAIRGVLAPFVERNVPTIWTIGPYDEPRDLGERLLAMGLHGPDVTPGMALDLSLVDEEPLPAGFEISQVASADDWRDFSLVLCSAFDLPSEMVEPAATVFQQAYAGNANAVALLGRLDGKPIATSMGVVGHGLSGVFAVGTLAEARGKGIGRAITLEACLFGKRRGYRTAILQASELGRPVYERMGFKKVCELPVYAWLPGMSAP